jgi:hypothetical protein
VQILPKIEVVLKYQDIGKIKPDFKEVQIFKILQLFINYIRNLKDKQIPCIPNFNELIK